MMLDNFSQRFLKIIFFIKVNLEYNNINFTSDQSSVVLKRLIEYEGQVAAHKNPLDLKSEFNKRSIVRNIHLCKSIQCEFA